MIEAVVLALLIGMVIRTFWTPTERFAPGISFTAKPLLEVGIVLLGASLFSGTTGEQVQVLGYDDQPAQLTVGG